MTRALAVTCLVLLAGLAGTGWLLRGAWRDEAQAQEALRASQARAAAESVEVGRLAAELARRDEITALLADWRADLLLDREDTDNAIATAVEMAPPEYHAARDMPVPDAVFDRLREFAAGGASDGAGTP